MSAARRVAVAVVALSLAVNSGTLWTLFGTDFISRFVDVGVSGVYALFVYTAVGDETA